jgi:hypothetical protein
MSKSSVGKQEGPIRTEMEWIPGDPMNHSATGGADVNGISGYPKGTPTKLPEVAFDNSDKFGKVPKAKD